LFLSRQLTPAPLSPDQSLIDEAAAAMAAAGGLVAAAAAAGASGGWLNLRQGGVGGVPVCVWGGGAAIVLCI
jgi:hypothetical protein